MFFRKIVRFPKTAKVSKELLKMFKILINFLLVIRSLSVTSMHVLQN